MFTLERGPKVAPGQMRVIVTAGFGGFLSHGGSSLDTHALTSAGHDKREASVRVWGLTGMEQGVLSLAACAAAIVMLATGRNVPPLNFTLPWAVIPVPGFLLAFWLAERYRGRLQDKRGVAGKAGSRTVGQPAGSRAARPATSSRGGQLRHLRARTRDAVAACRDHGTRRPHSSVVCPRRTYRIWTSRPAASAALRTSSRPDL